jgi:hypothetical protein
VKRWLFPLLTVALSLGFLELVLAVAGRVSPLVRYHLSPPWSRNTVPDPVLGVRMSTFYPGHDFRGYRNPGRRLQCDVLAVGDSQTYGYAAPPDGSWPAHLERLSGRCAYNAGVGGYCPPEYEVVVGELLSLEPKMVILGLYPANDVSGAYGDVYIDKRFGELENDDPVTLQGIRDAEATPWKERARRLGVELDDVPAGSGAYEEGLLRRSAIYRVLR